MRFTKQPSSNDVLRRAILALPCALAAGGCVPDAPSEAVSQRATVRHAADDHTVTLITGDRVTLRNGAPLVTPGPGRTRLRFTIERDGDHVRVLPSDAGLLVATGQLDPALFDVTGLLAAGYGDAARDDVPLIITGTSNAAGFAPGVALGATVDRALPALHMLAVHQPKARGGAALAGLSALAGVAPRAGGPKIWLDRIRKPLLDHSVPQIGGDVAHARGFTGAGITVAVLDTGVDSTHPDLAGKVDVAEDFTGDGQGVLDVLGHGTHVASIIAGTGAASGGQFAGVAPDARLISGRVCSGSNCADSAMLAGMQWAAAEQHARIINLSIGGPDSAELDPLEQAVNTLSAELGTLFVIAAGNDGRASTIESPGSADAALTVGAVDRDESLAFFSSRGPRTGDGAIKPDVTAPGVEIVAARASGVDPIGTPVGTAYQALSGTSMATPHVAGAAALLLQQHPDWTGPQLKAQLVASAKPNPELDVFAEGAGRIDLDRGTRQDVSADPTALSLGVASFPHDDDPPIVRAVRYHNGGAAPITLALSASLTGPAGPGSIALSQSSVTVPAGGTSADVVVTVRTDGALADGLYSGVVVATAGDVRVETPVGVNREVQAFDVTFRMVDDGAPGLGLLHVFSVATRRTQTVLVNQAITLHLARDQYVVTALLFDRGASTVFFPRFSADADQTVTFDSAQAAPIDVDVGDPTVALATSAVQLVDYETRFAASSAGFGLSISTGQIGGDLPPDQFIGWATESLSEDQFGAPKTIYDVAHGERGHVPRGFQARLTPAQLTTVQAHHAGQADAHYNKGALAVFDDGARGLQAFGVTSFGNYDGPFDRTEHYFGEGFQWEQTFLDSRIDPTQSDFPLEVGELHALRRYTAGQHVRETWNAAPAGPVFSKIDLFLDGAFRASSTAVRTGDDLVVLPSMFGDASVPAHFLIEGFVHQRIALKRNGTQIFEAIDAEAGEPITVPPGAATYRYEQDTERDPAVFSLSPHVTAAWTFRSQHTSATIQPLPLLSMRFEPALDDQGTTAARVLVLPIRFERAPDAGAALVLHAELEVSFDGGAHFTRVPVAALGDRALAVIVHPRGAKTVSLRGRATDLGGSQVELTIVDAYGLR